MPRASSALQFTLVLFAAVIGIVTAKTFVMHIVLAPSADIATNETVQEIPVSRPVAIPKEFPSDGAPRADLAANGSVEEFDVDHGPPPDIPKETPSDLEVGPPMLGIEWNSEAAQAIAIEQLTKALGGIDNAKCDMDCGPAHWFLGEQDVGLNGETRKALLFGSNTGGRCHACNAVLSLFEWESRDAHWTMSNSKVAFVQWWDWGTIAPEEVSLHQLDEHSYAILLTSTSLNFGQSYTDLRIYWRHDDKIDPILMTAIGEDDDGFLPEEDKKSLTQWHAAVSFVPVPNDKPELVLTRRGVYAGRAINEVLRYRFMDNKYVQIRDSHMASQ